MLINTSLSMPEKKHFFSLAEKEKKGKPAAIKHSTACNLAIILPYQPFTHTASQVWS